jgi:peroxiredoxin
VEPPVEAPAFTLPALDGRSVSLSEYQGQVVIMEFWATWCGPCRGSLPSLEAVYKRERGRGVSVLLINQGEPVATIRKWAGTRFTAPMLLDADGQVSRAYGVHSIPRLFIVDPQGRIVYEHSGYGGGLERNLRLILDDLLMRTQPGAT